MPVVHNLSPDQLLTTTRAVRKRLDFDRPVSDEIIRECLAIAQQAPTASNRQNWHFVVVTDAEKRQALADLYRRGWDQYTRSPTAAANLEYEDPIRAAVQQRVGDSAQYLSDNLHRAPVMVVPCIAGRTDNASSLAQSAQWGTIMPAAWSLMLAARARGIGSVFTCIHLMHEQEAAQILDIPYRRVMQAGLIPMAYTIGDRFRPAHRESLDDVVHWNGW
ncbi:MAG: nitroreductase family protein [Dehalococcoidia bacterium]|nr:nitroreductase family protein [Dehalococcoidia bacterium]